MLDAKETQKRLVECIRKRGPSLPIQLAKDVGLSSLFVSAFLSELYGDKQIKISSLKVGGTPLYFLEGQEEQLEKFYNYLNSKEAEVFLELKKNKILRDSFLEPASRVAIRAIRDFAFSFKNDNEIYWRFHTVSVKDVEDYFSLKKEISIEKTEEKLPEKIDIKNENSSIVNDSKKQNEVENLENNGLKQFEKPIEIEIKQTRPEKEILISFEKEKPKETVIEFVSEQKKIERPVEIKIQTVSSEEFNNPLAPKPEVKPKKDKPKSEFVLEIIQFIEKSGFKIIEERDHKAKEYTALVQINSDLGPIVFLTFAKEKKSVSDSDLKKHLSDAQTIPLPCLVIYTGELTKKAKEYQEKYTSILKALNFSKKE